MKIRCEEDYWKEFYNQMKYIDEQESKKEPKQKTYKLIRKENSNGNTKHSNRN